MRFIETECFGEVHEKFVGDKEAQAIRDMPNICVATDPQQVRPYELGFFLPHGTSGDSLKEWAEQTEIRYKWVKEAFEQMMGEGTWGSTLAPLGRSTLSWTIMKS